MSYSLTTIRRYFLRRKLRGFRVDTTGVLANEVQTLTMSTAGGAASGGTFTITYSGQTTGTIVYNASAATVQAALVALSNIGTDDVSVTGSAGGPWTVTFQGSLDQTDVALMTSDAALVTGPGSPYTLAVAETQKGGWVGTVLNSNADQRRMVVSSNYASQAMAGGVESDLDPDLYGNAYLYLPSTGEQRRIVKNGYSQAELASDITDQSLLTSTYIGYVTVDRPFAAVVAANLDVEISARLPILDTDLLTGVHSLINFALNVMMVPDRIAIAGVSDANQYTLASYPWLMKQSQLIGVVAPETTSNVEPIPLAGRHRIRRDAEGSYLSLDNFVATGDTFWIDVWRPRSSWIKVGSTWASSTAGLVNESDEAEVDLDQLATVAYYFACVELAEHGPDGTRAHWEREREKASSAAAKFMREQYDEYDDPTPIVAYRGDRLRALGETSHSSVGGWP